MCEGLKWKPWVTENFKLPPVRPTSTKFQVVRGNVAEGVSPLCNTELHPEAHEDIFKKEVFTLYLAVTCHLAWFMQTVFGLAPSSR